MIVATESTSGVTVLGEPLRRTLAFLNGIGMACHLVPEASGFVPGVRIVAGELFVDATAPASNVLHEAGHLAVLPGRFRRLANDDIDVVVATMLGSVDFSDPDIGEARAAMQSSDVEATAWAWAAGEAIGLNPGQIIRDVDYQGSGAEVRQQLRLRAYVGINGLSAAGFCVTRPALEKVYGRPAYPKLAMWLQSDFGAAPALEVLVAPRWQPPEPKEATPTPLVQRRRRAP